MKDKTNKNTENKPQKWKKKKKEKRGGGGEDMV